MRAVQPAALTILLLAGGVSTACTEEGDIRVSNLEFEGVEQIDEGALRDAIVTREGSWLPWGRKRYFDRRAYEADLQRIVAFYRDRGFPDARVTVGDLELNDEKNAVDITIHVEEGEPIVVSSVDFIGFDVLPDWQVRRLRREMALQPEEPLDTLAAAATRESALNLFRNNGYPYASIALRNEPTGQREERVVYNATPGTLARFGEVEINGEASVDDNVIRRQLTIEPGDVYSREDMRESQRKLYRMELFQFVNVEPLENETEQLATVPVRVTVGEGKHRRLNFGVGYGSEEKARVRARWDHVNFFGGARNAGIEGRWSSLDRGVRADFREPFFLHRNLSLNVEGQAWNAEEPVYTQNTVGGRVSLRFEPDERNFMSVSVINEYQQSSVDVEALIAENFDIRDELIALGLDPRDGESEGTVSAVAFDVGRNTTNNILDARRGYVLNGHVEQAGGWLRGTYRYWSATAEARHYQRVGQLFVLANRINVGSIDPAAHPDADELNVPFHKRFFLGGASSNRGWGRFEVSPLSTFGFPIGGFSMLEGSSEVRFPVWGKLGGVLFIDAGNVWPAAWEFDVKDLRYSVGPGFRYQTPIGPARVDLGYQLNPIDNLLVEGEPQKRRWRVHFSIGQAF